jgi:hypothetical protein
MDPRERDALIESVLSAWRPRTPDGQIHPHPAWADLSEADRRAAFDAALRARSLESLLDPDGLSTTVRAVLGRGLSRLTS